MTKNNFFDKNIDYQEYVILNPPRPRFVDGCKTSYVANIDELKGGVRSNLSMEKVGSDTRSYFKYRESIDSSVKRVKMK